ncbi:MAG: fluoride efflux transporter CrcB [Ignavibacteriaceae bacterium]|nr:fluoride efflux transporter CrcB [Ignavibacteriaceae bacterium]
MIKYLLIGTGGFIGSVLRYWTSVNAYKIFGEKFPYGTFAVNVIGCLLIGFIAEISENRFLISSEVRTFLMIGFLGGYTTFSTFGYETFTLLQDKDYLTAGLNILLSVVVCLFAVWLGTLLAKLF